MSNAWQSLQGDGYLLEDLGRPAVFLLPSYKLKKLTASGKSAEEDLHTFIKEHFGSFTTTLVPYFGFWKTDDLRLEYDECRLYEISFLGKNRIPALLKKLAEIATLIGEECIYFKAGQYACLVYPKK